jgi:hypothetical protein
MGSLTIYSLLSFEQLSELLKEHDTWFESYLHELYEDSDDKSVHQLDELSEELAYLEAHPIHEELTFELFETMPEEESSLRKVFEQAQGCLLFNNLPDLHTNALQVTVIKSLLDRLQLGLVDCEGEPHAFSVEKFKLYLSQSYKEVTRVVVAQPTDKPRVTQFISVDSPIEARLFQIKQAMKGSQPSVLSEFVLSRPKFAGLVEGLKQGVFHQRELLALSGLNPKDFGDGLDSLYFYLKKQAQ